MVIITGQGPLYHLELTLSKITALSNSLSEKILAASFLARIPCLPSNGLVGFTGTHSIPLTTCAKGYVFNKSGDFSSYPQHQATRLIKTAIAVKKLLDNSDVYNSFPPPLGTTTLTLTFISTNKKINSLTVKIRHKPIFYLKYNNLYNLTFGNKYYFLNK